MSIRLNSLFQVGLDVLDRSCLIIGGGDEAETKSARLLAAGARLQVVSPKLTDQLQQWVTDATLTHHIVVALIVDEGAIDARIVIQIV